MLAVFLRHPDSCVTHFESGVFVVINASTKGYRPTLRHCVHRIENQVGQHITQFSVVTCNRRNLIQLPFNVNGDIVPLCFVLPLWLCEFDGL